MRKLFLLLFLLSPFLGAQVRPPAFQTNPEGSVNFANLPSPTTNGLSFYCPDCVQTTPCAGSGTGAFAQSIAGVWACGGGGGGGGSVSSFSAGTLSPLFTTSVATPTTTPALSFLLSNFGADAIFGNFTGGSAAPSTQAIPTCPNDGSHALVYTSHTLTCEVIVGGGSITSIIPAVGADAGILVTNGSGPTVTIGIDPTLILTNANAEAGLPTACQDTSGSNTSFCTLSALAALTSYTTNMQVMWIAGATNSSTCPTLNIDGLGAKTITMNDGSTCPAPGSIISGTTKLLTFDGTVFRTQDPPSILIPGSLQTGVGTGVSGLMACGAGTSHPAIAAGRAGFGCPSTLTNPLELDFPNSQPLANQVAIFPAPTSNVSQWSWFSVLSGWWVAGGGTAQAQTATYSPAITSLQDGLLLCWKPSNANSGTAPTFSPNGLTAHTIVGARSSTPLVANDLIPTQQACAIYDSTGTQWELQNPATSQVTTQSAGDNSTNAASTSFVTTAVNNAIAAVNPAVAVLAASTTNLVGSYSNGVGGIGATFTVTATGAFTLDGIAINTIGQRVLLKNQSTAFQNGVYTATVVGTTGVSPIFTRALDFDQPSDINNTGAIPVVSGTVNAQTQWVVTSTVNTVGTDAITFTQFSLNPSTLATCTGDLSGTAPGCTVSKVNGGSVPASAAVVGTNGSSQPIAATGHGVVTPLSCADTSGSGSAQSCTTTPSFTPGVRDVISYTTTTQNTGALTLAVNGGSAAAVQKWQGTALASGDLKANIPVLLSFDGTNWQIDTIGNPPSGGSGYSTVQNPLGTSLTQRTVLGLQNGLTASDDSTNTRTTLNNTLPIDTRMIVQRDEFTASNTTSGRIGDLAWTNSVIAGTCTATSGTAAGWPNLGIVVNVTGASSGNGCAFNLTGSTMQWGQLGNHTNSFWIMSAVYKLEQTATEATYVGFTSTSPGTLPPANFIGARYDTTLGTPDTNFQLCVYNGATATTCSAQGAADTNFHTLVVYSDEAYSEVVLGTIPSSPTNQKIWMQWDGGTGVSFCSASCTVTVTVPNGVAVAPQFALTTATTAAAKMDIDFWGFQARVSTTTTNKRQ